MRKAWLVGAVAVLTLAVGCSTTPGGGPTRTGSAATTAAVAATAATTAAPSRLTKAQFTSELKSAGWFVGSDAYTAAVTFCVGKTSDEDLRHFAELAKPEASDHMLDVYVDAVRHSC